MGRALVVTIGVVCLGLGSADGILALQSVSRSQAPSVRTQHNDQARTGVNDRETQLTPDVLTAGKIAKIAQLDVVGQVYAQPLYIPDVAIGTSRRNVVLVATMRNNVYAFDARSYQRLWARNFGCSVPFDLIKLTGSRFGFNIHEWIGILGTPTVDADGRYIYFVTKTDDANGKPTGDPVTTPCETSQRHDLKFTIHKVEVSTGADAVPPQEIVAFVSPEARLDPFRHLQRPGLLLANGSVYVAFGGHQDTPPYHGWVFRFDATNLRELAVFCDTPNGKEGGIWQAGGGLAADSKGDVYFISGNGTAKGPASLGSAFVQLSPDLTLRHYYIPSNTWLLNPLDLDLGSSGPVILPGDEVVGGGKQGKLYFLASPTDGTNRFVVRDSKQITPAFGPPFIPPLSSYHIHGTTVAWSPTVGSAKVFIWGERDHLKRLTYTYGGGQGHITEEVTSPVSAPKKGMPGGIMSLSVNGVRQETAVLWASMPLSKDAFIADVPGVLRAVDPVSLKELWNNEKAESYLFAKYCPPTVIDGKVFLATFSGRVDVYGQR